MFRLLVAFIVAVAVVNASFHHKFHHHLSKHFTYDVNGFKGPYGEHGMYNGPFPAAPPPPQYGPFPHDHNHNHYYHHHHYHHDHHDRHPNFPEYPHHHGPHCHHNHGNGFPGDMVPFNPFNPFNVPNTPFNPMHLFNVPYFNPNQNNAEIPNQSMPPSNQQPFDPTSTFNANTPLAPFDTTNTVFTNPTDGQNPTVPNTPNNFDPFNGNVQPQNGKGTEHCSQQKYSTNVECRHFCVCTCIVSHIARMFCEMFRCFIGMALQIFIFHITQMPLFHISRE